MGHIPLSHLRWLANDLETARVDSPVSTFHPPVDVDGVYGTGGTLRPRHPLHDLARQERQT